MGITFGLCVVNKFTERFYNMVKIWRKIKYILYTYLTGSVWFL